MAGSHIRSFTSGRPWEDTYHKARGVAYGGFFETCLTSPSDPDGSIVAAGDLHGQTLRCYEIVLASLREAGFDIPDLVRVDVYLLDTKRWEEAARAHQIMIGKAARPAVSFLGLANFWHPDIEVEVAIKAYRPD